MIGPTETPELWEFLHSLRTDDVLSGTIAAIESFGVFVTLDEGPEHPEFPGVGFITLPELSWRSFEDASEIVHVGQRVSCLFLQADTTNGEARLSLRTGPDPFQAFADRTAVGQGLRGRITGVRPFGVIVEVADGIQGVVHRSELLPPDVDPSEDAFPPGTVLTVVVTAVDRLRRTVSLSQRQAQAG
ncbi:MULTISPECIES: S1 RNA-binding domain-containing protein [Streptomyces griseus group]|uniref:S1 RNA-binding domain-containing protein n=1 Tax=Streptomyces griseus group TaxID=629295 RepID=UPI0036D81403